MEKLSNPKKLLIVAAVILLIVLIIGIVIYRSGKKSGKAEGVINLSNPVTDNATGSSSPSASTSEIKQLTEAVKQDLSGVNAFGHDIDLWSRVLTLSDTDFTRLYNEFNTKYQRDSGQSLKQWVDSDVDYFFQVGSKWGTIKQTVLAKMAKLNFV